MESGVDSNFPGRYAYNADGNVESLTAVNAFTGNQTTRYKQPRGQSNHRVKKQPRGQKATTEATTGSGLEF